MTRADGRVDEYERSAHWRVRYVVVFPDGSRAVRSKIAPQRPQAKLLVEEAGRLERVTRTGTATQQDLGQFSMSSWGNLGALRWARPVGALQLERPRPLEAQGWCSWVVKDREFGRALGQSARRQCDLRHRPSRELRGQVSRVSGRGQIRQGLRCRQPSRLDRTTTCFCPRRNPLQVS